MARLEAVAKALYYPTPQRVVGMIAGIVKPTVRIASYGCDKPSLLDPCAGEGTAAAILAKRWDVVAHGIELHGERAATASKVLSWARHGSYHQIALLNPDGKLPQEGESPSPPFGVLFLNPPYDEGTDEDGNKMRQEIEFLRATTRFLAPGGLLAFIPPRHILRSERFRKFMRDEYREIRAYAFPEPEVQAFDQVVVLATRSYRTGYMAGYGDVSALEDADNLPPLDAAEPYEVQLPAVDTRVTLAGDMPESYVPADGEGAWASQQWLAQTGDRAAHELAPLTAPRPGHQAMLLAAGALNGLEIDTDDGCEGFSCEDVEFGSRLLVKGGSTKVITKIEGKADENGTKETIHRERISSYLSVLDLRTGILDTWQVDDDQAKTAKWFEQHGDALAAGILGAHAPQFTAAHLEHYDFSRLTAPGVLPGRSAPEILPVQREAAAAVVHRWYGPEFAANRQRRGRRRRVTGHKAVILCGEMGTGKTTCGTVACELARSKKNIIVCPTHLTRKWAREVETITGRKGCALIAKKLSDVDAFFADPRLSYLVLSKEVAKLGARWEPATARGSKIIEVEETRERQVPYSYAPHETYTERYKETVRKVRKFKACPGCGREVTLDAKAQSRCGATGDVTGIKGCGEPLFQYTPITAKGTKRWPLASYIHGRYARQYTLVVDEAHQHAKGETDQARAVHQLMSGARKILMMTGTLYGGRASSIFHLLYRLDPSFRRTYKHTDCATFVEHHGLFETVFKEEERSSTYGYRKGNTGGRIKEIPGMSPAMIPMLLPYTIFVKLRDLRLELPPYTEEVRIVEPDAATLSATTTFQSKLQGLLRKHPRVMGAYLQACLGYPDRADQAEAIYDIDEEGQRTNDVLATAPALPDASHPKDDDLLELVREEHAQGRKVLVFFAQTQRRDARPRARAVLEAAGFKVVTLDSNVAPEKREDWMRDRVTEGFDVMFTNGRLVETGLDLMFANTIVQYSIEFSINTLRQSIRRSWRLGQTKPVRVIFMAYKGTMQETATNLIARKMRAAELVDGDEAGGLAQFDAGGGNFLLELAHEVLEAA